MFGNAMEAYVLQQLADPAKPLEPLHIKGRDRLYHILLSRLNMKERDVHRGKCVPLSWLNAASWGLGGSSTPTEPHRPGRG